MLFSHLGPALAGPPPPLYLPATLWTVAWALGLLFGATGFALLRAAMEYSRSTRVISLARSERSRERLTSALARIDELSTSAGVLKVTCELIFMALLLGLVQAEGDPLLLTIFKLVMIAVPALLLFTESLPHALARKHGDALLVRALPGFRLMQLPLQALVVTLEALRRAIWRMTDTPVETPETRELVEGLREVLHETTRHGDFDDSERELIENVIEFADVDVAEIMTPRTEIHGVDLEDGLTAVIRLAAEEGHSRIPVFEENLDNIVGYLSARGIVQILSDQQLEGANLREHLRPVYFVPETKQVSELLAEFRSERRKLAIVLDEYGGTAGLVTLGDILGEIVGDIGDEYDREDPPDLRIVCPGIAEISAGVRIAEVNEALALKLPEEADFETLGGFVLAELGHFPRRGEVFSKALVKYEILDASDRRVLLVRVVLPNAEAG
ncbi:MAG: hemolysin family protein [bacterium]|nr:HlyC/CorC family transporter [Planctomycetota bacterium]HIL52788.1 HlyC/CorC family transporter [Planctomycetota bacterium]